MAGGASKDTHSQQARLLPGGKPTLPPSRGGGRSSKSADAGRTHLTWSARFADRVEPELLGGSRCRGEPTDDDREGRRLASTVRTDKSANLARSDRERQVPEDLDGATLGLCGAEV